MMSPAFAGSREVVCHGVGGCLGLPVPGYYDVARVRGLTGSCLPRRWWMPGPRYDDVARFRGLTRNCLPRGRWVPGPRGLGYGHFAGVRGLLFRPGLVHSRASRLRRCTAAPVGALKRQAAHQYTRLREFGARLDPLFKGCRVFGNLTSFFSNRGDGRVRGTSPLRFSKTGGSDRIRPLAKCR
jgi:hypothetical protein